MKIIIGSDECLKGDTFGGLVVAGVAANPSQREELKKIGVCDSKKVRDDKIPLLAAAIKRTCKWNVAELFPVEYNKVRLTNALNDMHNHVGDELRKEYLQNETMHVVDQYPGCSAGDVRIVRAEAAYIEVAAASIIARASALEQFAILSSQLGFTVPKGSTHVLPGLIKLRESKKDPKLYVKTHFRNVKEFFSKK